MCSQVVSHPSTDIANVNLTSVIGRELVNYDVCGRSWKEYSYATTTILERNLKLMPICKPQSEPVKPMEVLFGPMVYLLPEIIIRINFETACFEKVLFKRISVR